MIWKNNSAKRTGQWHAEHRTERLMISTLFLFLDNWLVAGVLPNLLSIIGSWLDCLQDLSHRVGGIEMELPK